LWINTSDFVAPSQEPALPDSTELQTALAKDVMLIESTAGTQKARAVAEQLRTKFALGAEQIAALQPFVAAENAILRGLGAGEEWISDETSRDELIGRAAAVGIPLAALHVAGISGFGAAGITSGLASLGAMSGLTVLGLNPMTAGIGALILGGITVKKVADYAFAQSRRDEADEAALEELRALKRRTAAYLAQDLAIVGKPRTTDRLKPGKRASREALAGAMERTLETAMAG
jgi:hypothetical protein